MKNTSAQSVAWRWVRACLGRALLIACCSALAVGPVLGDDLDNPLKKPDEDKVNPSTGREDVPLLTDRDFTGESEKGEGVKPKILDINVDPEKVYTGTGATGPDRRPYTAVIKVEAKNPATGNASGLTYEFELVPQGGGKSLTQKGPNDWFGIVVKGNQPTRTYTLKVTVENADGEKTTKTRVFSVFKDPHSD